MFALWTWSCRAVGAAPPVGDVETVALVVPTPDLSKFEVSDVDCALIEPDRLAGALLDSPGRSVDAWRARIAGGDSALPIAGHAVPDATGAAVTSAEHAVAVFRHTTAVAAELRTALAAELRPYQVRGVSWLREAVDAHGGAVLADEMGLGKTLQAIGYLVGRADEGPQVVVCPTSLVGNWAHEIARFAPDLRTMIWRGGPLEAIDNRTVVLTGYPTLRIHSPVLMEHHWATAVFDEAQVLKNPRTQVSKAARTIAADARIALTGTPVENHLEELWALLNLVAPQLFGHKAQFRRRFIRPIADGSLAAATRLRLGCQSRLIRQRKPQRFQLVHQRLRPQVRVLGEPGSHVLDERFVRIRQMPFPYARGPLPSQIGTNGLPVTGMPGDLRDRPAPRPQGTDFHIFLTCQHGKAGLLG
jgi:hypothetical protein